MKLTSQDYQNYLKTVSPEELYQIAGEIAPNNLETFELNRQAFIMMDKADIAKTSYIFEKLHKFAMKNLTLDADGIWDSFQQAFETAYANDNAVLDKISPYAYELIDLDFPTRIEQITPEMPKENLFYLARNATNKEQFGRVCHYLTSSEITDYLISTKDIANANMFLEHIYANSADDYVIEIAGNARLGEIAEQALKYVKYNESYEKIIELRADREDNNWQKSQIADNIAKLISDKRILLNTIICSPYNISFNKELLVTEDLHRIALEAKNDITRRNAISDITDEKVLTKAFINETSATNIKVLYGKLANSANIEEILKQIPAENIAPIISEVIKLPKELLNKRAMLHKLSQAIEKSPSCFDYNDVKTASDEVKKLFIASNDNVTNDLKTRLVDELPLYTTVVQKQRLQRTLKEPHIQLETISKQVVISPHEDFIYGLWTKDFFADRSSEGLEGAMLRHIDNEQYLVEILPFSHPKTQQKIVEKIKDDSIKEKLIEHCGNDTKKAIRIIETIKDNYVIAKSKTIQDYLQGHPELIHNDFYIENTYRAEALDVGLEYRKNILGKADFNILCVKVHKRKEELSSTKMQLKSYRNYANQKKQHSESKIDRTLPF